MSQQTYFDSLQGGTKLVMRQGDTYGPRVANFSLNGSLVGQRVAMVVKRTLSTPDDVAPVRIDSEGDPPWTLGVTIDDDATATFAIPPAQTTNLKPGIVHYWAIKVFLVTGEERTTDSGTVEVLPQVVEPAV